MNHIHLTNDNVIHSYIWKGKLSLLNVIMSGLSRKLAKQSMMKDMSYIV